MSADIKRHNFKYTGQFMGVAIIKLKGGGGKFLKLIYSAVFDYGKKLEDI